MSDSLNRAADYDDERTLTIFTLGSLARYRSPTGSSELESEWEGGPPFWGVRGPKTPFLGGFGGVPGGSGGGPNALETTKKSQKTPFLAPPKRDGGRDGGKFSAEIPSLEFSPRY